MSGLLDYERAVAKPGYNRWLVPPAALAVHLSIGQVYALSVFKLPLSHALGITTPVAQAGFFTMATAAMSNKAREGGVPS